MGRMGRMGPMSFKALKEHRGGAQQAAPFCGEGLPCVFHSDIGSDRRRNLTLRRVRKRPAVPAVGTSCDDRKVKTAVWKGHVLKTTLLFRHPLIFFDARCDEMDPFWRPAYVDHLR